MAYGKFASFEMFLDSYLKDERKKQLAELKKSPRAAQPLLLRKRKQRDVVEIKANVKKRLEDDTTDDKHHHLKITVKEIVDTDIDVDKDLTNSMEKSLPVFVSIRFGDRAGIPQPIKEGIDEGCEVHLRGEWIPKEKAYAHGGEKMSVLHFTHHPLGFVCTEERCYE